MPEHEGIDHLKRGRWEVGRWKGKSSGDFKVYGLAQTAVEHVETLVK